MHIEFIKTHVSGIAKGTFHKVEESFGERMIKAKFAKESNEEAYDEYHNGLKESL